MEEALELSVVRSISLRPIELLETVVDLFTNARRTLGARRPLGLVIEGTMSIRLADASSMPQKKAPTSSTAVGAFATNRTRIQCAVLEMIDLIR